MIELILIGLVIYAPIFLCQAIQAHWDEKIRIQGERWIQAQALQDEQLQDHLVDKLLNTRRFNRVSKFDE